MDFMAINKDRDVKVVIIIAKFVQIYILAIDAKKIFSCRRIEIVTLNAN
jgi:hypothetical protein